MAQESVLQDSFESFRTGALARIASLETCWDDLKGGVGTDHALERLRSDVSTLKSESSVVGLRPIAHLCEKLEDLVEVSTAQHFQVPDEIDLLVTMALELISVCLRAKVGTAVPGVDVDGFIIHVEHAIRRSWENPSPDALSAPGESQVADSDVLDPVLRRSLSRLGVAAATAFVEYQSASGASRKRLRNLWLLLRQEIEEREGAPLDPIIRPHIDAGAELAVSLGKDVAFELTLGVRSVPPGLAHVVDASVLHLIHSAVAYGIEDPVARVAAKKSKEGRVRIEVHSGADTMLVSISDDGLGSLQLASRDAGLEAVRALVVGAGGAVDADATPGRGTTWALSMTRATTRAPVLRFMSARSPLVLAVTGDWTVTPVRGAVEAAVDPVLLIGIASGEPRRGEGASADLVFRLERGDQEFFIASAEVPRPAQAHRVCPTGADHPVEVVILDGVEGLLIRPENLFPRAQPKKLKRVAEGSKRNLLLRADLAVGHQTIHAHTVAVSESSVIVRTDVPIESGARVRVRLSFPQLLEPLELTAYAAGHYGRSIPGEPAGVTLIFASDSEAAREVNKLLDPARTALAPAPYRVLFVDDSVLTTKVFQVSLSRYAQQTGSCLSGSVSSDGEQALSMLRKGDYDLAFIDYAMASLTGDVVIERLRRAGNDMAIVGVSSLGTAAREHMLAAGADLFLDKPLSMQDVFFTLERLLAVRDRRAPTPRATTPRAKRRT